MALWFLPALFFADLLLFGFCKAFRGNRLLMGFGTFATLALGILFNAYNNRPLVWNFDATFFGIAFTYCGYLLQQKYIAAVYQKLVRNRIIALLAGALLLVSAYFFSTFIYETEHLHLEMFARRYGSFYLTLPCALLGLLGFTVFC